MSEKKPIRRTIKKNRQPWQGWERMKAIVEKGMGIPIPGTDATAGELEAVLFSGGFRCMEAVRGFHPEGWWSGLKPENIQVNDEAGTLDFEDVPQEKRYSKVKGTRELCRETGPHRDKFGRWHGGQHESEHHHFQTERKQGEEVLRQSYAPLKEPFVPIILKLVERVKVGNFLFPCSRTTAWRVIEQTDPTTWPHWYRSQRAAQLGARHKDGGYNFSRDQLQDYFNWTTQEMAKIYAGTDLSQQKEKAVRARIVS